MIPELTASFAICTISGECDAIFSPSLIASLTTWSAGKTLLTKPDSNTRVSIIQMAEYSDNTAAHHKVFVSHCCVSIRLAIYKLQIRVLAGHYCVVALGKLISPVCLCHRAA